MKLKDYLMNEMGLPMIDNAEQARKVIMQIAPLVRAGQIKGDYIGTLDAALTAIKNCTNPEAYIKETKMAIEAKKLLMAHRAKLSAAQPQHTAVKPTDSYGK